MKRTVALDAYNFYEDGGPKQPTLHPFASKIAVVGRSYANILNRIQSKRHYNEERQKQRESHNRKKKKDPNQKIYSMRITNRKDLCNK